MGTLIGRDAEFARCRAVFDSSAKGGYVRAVRIAGLSGAGKTALALEVATAAQASGWLVAETPNFRIHSGLPLFAARRIMQSLLDALGADAARYESGLAVERDRPDVFEEAFLRLLEGVTLDHRVVLFMDDAQWADAQSRSLVASTMTTLADRAIVLLSTERSDEAVTPAFALVDETVALGDLSQSAAASVVREIYPEVTGEVAEAIAQATRGHAVDLIAVATAARENGAKTVRDVTESTGRIVARDLAVVDPPVRTFLQICALIEEPIELELLRRLWPQEQLLAMIEQLSGRYLVTQPDGLHFVHAAIAESVLQTIPIEMPLRYRIIEAIKTLPAPRLEDYERLAKQSAACGDRELERETLLKLSDAAAARGLTALAAESLERALNIRQPDGADIVPTYTRLSNFYNALGRELECIRVCQAGLSEAQRAGVVSGIGGIVASMIIAMWHAGRAADARDELARYGRIVIDDSDRAQLASAGSYVGTNCLDEAMIEQYAHAYAQAQHAAAPTVATRFAIARAQYDIRAGNLAGTLESLRNVDRLIAALPPAMGATQQRFMHTFHELYTSGVAAAEHVFQGSDVNPQDPVFLVLRPTALFARGALQDAADFVFERHPTLRDPMLRRFMMGAASTATALREAPPEDPAWKVVQSEAALFESGIHTSALWPTAAAWASYLSGVAPKRARSVLAQLVAAMREPADFGVITYPVVLVATARKLNDRAALELIASQDGIWCDRHAWARAHAALARGIASATLGYDSAAALLNDAAERFDRLDAPFFAELARNANQPAAPATKEFLGNTTRREREIAALVSEGLTNRQIAEKLVLSERTVEGHIANLFAKVNVNSRTQLTAWYLRSVSPVA